MQVRLPPLTADSADDESAAAGAVAVGTDVVAATGDASAAAAAASFLTTRTTATPTTCDAPTRTATEQSGWESATASVRSAGNPDSSRHRLPRRYCPFLTFHCRYRHHLLRRRHPDWSHFHCRAANWRPPNRVAR